jgi:hypothetical protein
MTGRRRPGFVRRAGGVRRPGSDRRPGVVGRPGRALGAAFVIAGALLAACVGGAPAARTSGPLATAQPSASAAVEATLAQLDAALRASGLVVESTLTAVRPAEPPSFAGVARWPFHAVLPDDPAGGYLVIYEFPGPALAANGGRDLAAYISSGPGRVQYAPDIRFVLRQVGSTLVFYPWSPASSPDRRTPDLAAALASVGSEVPVPLG